MNNFRLTILILLCLGISIPVGVYAQELTDVHRVTDLVRSELNSAWTPMWNQSQSKYIVIHADFDNNKEADFAVLYWDPNQYAESSARREAIESGKEVPNMGYLVIAMQKGKELKLEVPIKIKPFKSISPNMDHFSLSYQDGYLSWYSGHSNESKYGKNKGKLIESTHYNYLKYTLNGWGIAKEKWTAGSIGSQINYTNKECRKSYKKSKVDFQYIAANSLQEVVNIDGKFDEQSWTSSSWTTMEDPKYLMRNSDEWHGVDDLSYKTAMLWDEQHFYLALDVVDNGWEPAYRVDSSNLEGDLVEYWFGTESLCGLFFNMQLGLDKNNKIIGQLHFVKSAYRNLNVAQNIVPIETIEGLRVEYQQTDNGYRVELMLPFSLFAKYANCEAKQAVLHPRKTIHGRYDYELDYTVVVKDKDPERKEVVHLSTSTTETFWTTSLGKVHFFDQFQDRKIGN
ncbi:MAG: hypothetical protein GY810_09265 [Aureispira sp.]|nr:hypothetical protein [Aureispira sp.]